MEKRRRMMEGIVMEELGRKVEISEEDQGEEGNCDVNCYDGKVERQVEIVGERLGDKAKLESEGGRRSDDGGKKGEVEAGGDGARSERAKGNVVVTTNRRVWINGRA